MALHLTGHRDGFRPGLTHVTTVDDETGIALGVLKLRAGEDFSETTSIETAWLVMHGEVELTIGDAKKVTVHRESIFDQLPTCAHVSAGTSVSIRALREAELTVYRTDNSTPFEARIYVPDDVRDEHRGKGQVANACYRFVRTIFDDTNSPKEAQLVLGEVITMPGRWSSYPPHHHPQPEIYHYRFTEPQGYGHAELGETVVKVRQYDTVKIFDGNDHAQTAAPGYGMYYAWVIRHLPDRRYDVPEFTEEHRWTMQDDAPYWWPSGVDEQ